MILGYGTSPRAEQTAFLSFDNVSHCFWPVHCAAVRARDSLPTPVKLEYTRGRQQRGIAF